MIVNIKSRTVENEIKEDEGIKLTQATSETLKRYWPNRHNFNNHNHFFQSWNKHQQSNKSQKQMQRK